MVTFSLKFLKNLHVGEGFIYEKWNPCYMFNKLQLGLSSIK